MLRALILAAAAATAFGLAGCDRTDDAEVAVAPGAGVDAPATSDAVAEAPPATTAAGFVARAALGDLYEVQSSRLALERSQSPRVKAFAQRMIDEHMRMSNEMNAAIAQAGLPIRPPAELDSARAELMRELREASPADFDDRYLDQQAEAHETTLNLFRDFGGNGDNEMLRQLAARAAPTIEDHLQTVRALDEGAADDGAGAAPSVAGN